MLSQCWSSAVGGGPILKQHWVKSSRLLGSTQVSVYTHPSPTIIFSPADHGTFSKTAGQSQAYYNTWNWERGTYDVNHLHILTCEVAVSSVGSVALAIVQQFIASLSGFLSYLLTFRCYLFIYWIIFIQAICARFYMTFLGLALLPNLMFADGRLWE